MTTSNNIPEEMIIEPGSADFYVRLGAAMRAARTRQGIPPCALATLIGIDVHQLEQYENGELAVPVYHLMPIYEHLNHPAELNKLGL